MLYADNAATTPMKKEALQAMWPYLTDNFGNPSSAHPLGENAAQAIKKARTDIAKIFKTRSNEIVFTSGGTEANNFLLKGIALGYLSKNFNKKTRRNKIIISTLEHSSIKQVCKYLEKFHNFEILFAPTQSDGLIILSQLEKILDEQVLLCSIAYANNEIGVIQDIAKIASLCNKVGTIFHTDAIQAATLRTINVTNSPIDAFSISGHKIGAGKGIGLAFLRNNIICEPLLHGGGQQYNKRSGTENVAAIVALAKAIEITVANQTVERENLTKFTKTFTEIVLKNLPNTKILGPKFGSNETQSNNRLESIVSICFDKILGETILLELEQKQIFASSGSACSAKTQQPSEVLLALGLSKQTLQNVVRFSFSTTTMHYTAESLAAEIVTTVNNLKHKFGK